MVGEKISGTCLIEGYWIGVNYVCGNLAAAWRASNINERIREHMERAANTEACAGETASYWRGITGVH